MLELLKDRIDESGDRQLKKMYRNALDHLDKAHAYYQEGSHEAAATQLQASRQIFNQIKRIIEHKG